MHNDLIFRLRERARIRRQISTRKSVQEGKPDRISDLLEEAANALDLVPVGFGSFAGDKLMSAQREYFNVAGQGCDSVRPLYIKPNETIADGYGGK